MVNHASSPCARARFVHPHEQHSQRVQRADLLSVTGVQAVFSPVLPLATASRHVSPLLSPYTPTGARGARPTDVFHRQKSPWPRWPTVFLKLRATLHVCALRGCRRQPLAIPGLNPPTQVAARGALQGLLPGPRGRGCGRLIGYPRPCARLVGWAHEIVALLGCAERARAGAEPLQCKAVRRGGARRCLGAGDDDIGLSDCQHSRASCADCLRRVPSWTVASRAHAAKCICSGRQAVRVDAGRHQCTRAV